MRQDISLAQQIVQSNHATFEMASWLPRDGPGGMIPSIVLIGIPHQRALEKVIRKLDTHQIGYKAFVEPDFDMGLSAVATVPLDEEQRQALRNYTTWKEQLIALAA